jgi:uncharacterized membrane protein
MRKRKAVAASTGRARGASGSVERTAPAPRDWIVAGLAIVGVALSLYLTITKLSGSAAAFCEAGTGCDVLQASQWATFLALPTAAWGIALYAALAVLALTGLTPARWVWAFVLATAAVAFSGYLTWIAAFVVRALCPWCLAVAGVGVATFVTLLVRRPHGGRRSPTRPARVTVIGGITVVVTVVLAAGVFVMDPLAGSTGYAADLARHLSATKSVMYGVFW